MIWQKILCKQSIGYWVVLGLVLIASTVSIEAQLVPGPVPVPSPQNTTVFSLPQNVSNSPDASSNHQIAVDSQGNINIIWLDKSPGYQAVFFSHSTDGGRSFSTLVVLHGSPPGKAVVESRLSIPPDGTLSTCPERHPPNQSPRPSRPSPPARLIGARSGSRPYR